MEYRQDKSKDVLVEAITDFLVQNLEILNNLNIPVSESKSKSEEDRSLNHQPHLKLKKALVNF